MDVGSDETGFVDVYFFFFKFLIYFLHSVVGQVNFLCITRPEFDGVTVNFVRTQGAYYG